jgi:ATP-dependent RNA helicase DDX51/DBP6
LRISCNEEYIDKSSEINLKSNDNKNQFINDLNQSQVIQQNIINDKNDKQFDENLNELEINDKTIEEIDEEINEEIDENNFTIIGEVKKDIKKKLKPIVYKWMTKPIVFESDIQNNNQSLDQFSNLINESLIEKLRLNGINQLFPVQQQVIPYLLRCFENSYIFRPKDICVSSPTGSGKTLSFVIPIVQHLLNRVITHVRVLVVLPVRDLAIQVYQVFEKYCKKTSLKVGLVIGHKSFTDECNALIRKSFDGLKYHSLVDILVATPGKLVDLIQRAPGFSLKHLEILVLDEADRMINDLQFNWLQEIEAKVFDNNLKYQCFCSIDIHNNEHKYSKRYNVQNLCSCYNFDSVNSKPIHKILFSATLCTDPEKLQTMSLFEPILFTVSSDSSSGASIETSKKHMIPIELQEFMIITKEDCKPLIIWYLIEVLEYRKVLCFTGSVENTHRLYSLLKQIPNISVAEFSSKLNAKKREKLLNKFIGGKIDVIVCSDIFARGLDIDGINCVICYDPPRNETAYIHRIGRTARAGNKGTAITLLTPLQLSHFNIVSRRAHERNPNEKKELSVKKMVVKESQLKPLMNKYKSALETLSKHVKYDEKKKKILKRSIKY